MQIDIDNLPDVLNRIPHYDQLLDLCADRGFLLVGGVLREALTGGALTDVDLISPDDPTALAKEFSSRIGGHWFWLDESRRQSRVVLGRVAHGPHFDFAQFRKPTLEGDLHDRDFTINALALPLRRDVQGASLYDPCRGQDDLLSDRLRMVGADSLANDPLRIVKGVRHATSLGLEIEPQTLLMMRRQAAGLERVAPERVRQEAWKILADPLAPRGLRLLGDCGAGGQLFGADFTEQCSGLAKRLEIYRQHWRYLVADQPVVGSWLAHEVEQGLSRELTLIWGLLLKDLSVDLPTRLAERWRLSRRARISVAAISALRDGVLDEFAGISDCGRAFAWWADRHGLEPKSMLLSLAVVGLPGRAPEPMSIRALVPKIEALADFYPADLVDGHWLQGELGIEAGPEMTRALQMLRDAEISGCVRSSEEARRFLRGHYRIRMDK